MSKPIISLNPLALLVPLRKKPSLLVHEAAHLKHLLIGNIMSILWKSSLYRDVDSVNPDVWKEYGMFSRYSSSGFNREVLEFKWPILGRGRRFQKFYASGIMGVEFAYFCENHDVNYCFEKGVHHLKSENDSFDSSVLTRRLRSHLGLVSFNLLDIIGDIIIDTEQEASGKLHFKTELRKSDPDFFTYAEDIAESTSYLVTAANYPSEYSWVYEHVRNNIYARKRVELLREFKFISEKDFIKLLS